MPGLHQFILDDPENMPFTTSFTTGIENIFYLAVYDPRNDEAKIIREYIQFLREDEQVISVSGPDRTTGLYWAVSTASPERAMEAARSACKDWHMMTS